METTTSDNLYNMQKAYHRRGRSYCSYGSQDKSQNATFMRPIPFNSTQEAWFLRPNLQDRYDGPFVPAPNSFAKQDANKTLPGLKNLYSNSGKVLLTIRNQTFYSNKFKTPVYTYSLEKSAKVSALFLNLAQTLLVDPKMFTHSDSQPEGFNVFYWCDDGAVKGTKMIKLDGNKTIADYGLDKNSVLYLKYRCRESKY